MGLYECGRAELPDSPGSDVCELLLLIRLALLNLGQVGACASFCQCNIRCDTVVLIKWIGFQWDKSDCTELLFGKFSLK